MDNKFAQVYHDKSDLELLLIALNVDGGYIQDASDAAKAIMSSRYKTSNLEQLLREIIERLEESAKGCNICHSPEVCKSYEIYLRKLVDIGAKSSMLGLASTLILGVGFIRENYAYQKMIFNLCQTCLDSHVDKKGRLKLSLEDYNQHPLFQLYRLLGYS